LFSGTSQDKLLGSATGAINLFNIELTDVFTVQNKAVLKYMKNHANRFRHFKDIDLHM